MATPSVFAALPEPEKKPESGILTSTDAVVMPPRRGAEKIYGPFVALSFHARAWAAPHLAGRGKFVAAGGGVVLLLLLVWLLWPTKEQTLKDTPLFAEAKTEPSSHAVGTLSSEAPAIEKSVTLKVQVTPAGAHVFPWINGELLPAEEAPYDLKVPKGAEVELTFAAPGYEPEQVSLTAESDQPIKASLQARGKKTSTGKGGSRTSRQGRKGGGGGGFFPGGR